jgi:hypothetical protein
VQDPSLGAISCRFVTLARSAFLESYDDLVDKSYLSSSVELLILPFECRAGLRAPIFSIMYIYREAFFDVTFLDYEDNLFNLSCTHTFPVVYICCPWQRDRVQGASLRAI